MSASYSKIDYRLRIAKSVERRMMCSLFQQLGVFHPLSQYKYIGFGSVSFLDFALFHKILGINDMVSIEREAHDKKRFEFNKPFNCIDLKFGESYDILPSLDIEHKSIVWLDFDDKLSTPILDDISLIFNRLNSGCMFCISFNAQHDIDSEEKSRFEQLCDRVDNRYFPQYLNEDTNLNKKNIRGVYYDIINNLIKDVLAKRHSNGSDIQAQQMLFFHYNDGAEMNTLCWVFHNSDDLPKVEIILNENFPFICKGKEAFEIKIPTLTFKEMKAIESKFPNIEECLKEYSKDKSGGIISPSDIEGYFRLYKNFSLFAEIHL